MEILRKLSVKSEQDGLKLGVWMCIPEGEPVGIIQISHGMSEHKERYEEFVRFLARNGFVVLINDHRGHGESVKTEKDLGYFYENGADFLVEDLHQLTLLAREQYPGKKLFLFGHSMGSLAVRAYAKKYDKDIDGLIVCGCPSKNSAAGIGKLLVKILSAVLGEKHRSGFIQKMTFGAYNKKFRPAVSENAWLSAREENVRRYDEDPLCGFVFTLNGFDSLLTLMQKVYDPAGWGVTNPQLPVWFISGEEDPCLINKAKFMEAVNLMKQVGYQDVGYRLYGGLRHEILNEECRQDIYRDVREKLNQWNQ